MGGGRDKRKKAKEKKDGPVPGKGQEKTERKTHKKEEKKQRKTELAVLGDEDDIDALLRKLKLEEEAQKAVTIEPDCLRPSPRVNASFTPILTAQANDILVFGGEYSDTKTGKIHVYNDLYRFSCDRHKWTKISSPNSPPPRSAHQAVFHKGCLYIFGGEFTSPNQARFYHYKDLWRLDLTNYEWDCLPCKGGPSARSGHRMVVHRGRALLFGGFYDTGAEVRYYNDLWEFEFETLKWRAVGAGAASLGPSPRSGCQLAVHEDSLYLYGGYSKVRDDEDAELEHGCTHDDMWVLDLKAHAWQRVRKVGMAPGPRASFSLALHRAGRMFLFGGASDHEAKGGEDLRSDFHNDLYLFRADTRRWAVPRIVPSKQRTAATAAAAAAAGSTVQQQQQQDGASSSARNTDTATTTATITAIPPSADAAASPAPAGGAVGGGSTGVSAEVRQLVAGGALQRDSAAYRAAVAIQSHFRGYVVRKAFKVYRLGGAVSEVLYSPAAFGLDLSERDAPRPRGRISAMVAVVGNTLFLWGGMVEVGEMELTLDDIWTLDLAKLDGWVMLAANSEGEELFRRAAASSGDDDDDDSGDDDDDDDDYDGPGGKGMLLPSKGKAAAKGP